MGITWLSEKSINPAIGDSYFDTTSNIGYLWDGARWAELSSEFSIPDAKFYAPTAEQLEKHPALKQAWDEYMVIRKLLGI